MNPVPFFDPMEKKGGDAEKVAIELRQALKDGRVEYFKVKTPIGTSKGVPVVKPTTIEQFQY